MRSTPPTPGPAKVEETAAGGSKSEDEKSEERERHERQFSLDADEDEEVVVPKLGDPYPGSGALAATSQEGSGDEPVMMAAPSP